MLRSVLAEKRMEKYPFTPPILFKTLLRDALREGERKQQINIFLIRKWPVMNWISNRKLNHQPIFK